ncbi:MAG TPA: CARDB domain-containing protein [Candidatus Thermoplasmatota archaeon]|jgi:subtilase family serine protease|nr:CARDB domain-containing protein [Candidatus Thermoplasmatota archaeon]
MRGRAFLILLAMLLNALPAGSQDSGGAAPDLEVMDLVASPANATAGSPVTFAATLNNTGNASAGPFNVTFSVDDDLVGTVEVPSLAAGNVTTVTSPPWNATAGSHQVKAVADANDTVNESDEANNERSTPLIVAEASNATQPPATPGSGANATATNNTGQTAATNATTLPDLSVRNFTIEPATPRPEQNVSFRATIANVGAGPAPAANLSVLLEGTSIASATVPLLGPGEEANVTLPNWTAVEGLLSLRAVVDPADVINESDERNNEMLARLEVRAPALETLPDLAIVTIDVLPQDAVARSNVTFQVRVENRGRGNASGFEVTFTLNGTLLGKGNASGLAPGEHVDVLSPGWAAAEGNHTVLVELDPADEVLENDQDPNARLLAFAVGARPPAPRADLAILSLGMFPPIPVPGDRVVFTAEVANRGEAEAPPFKVAFFAGDRDLGVTRVDGLAPGATADVESAPWLASEGTLNVRVELDASSEVNETVEHANNERVRALVVRAASTDSKPVPDAGFAGLAVAVAVLALASRRRA